MTRREDELSTADLVQGTAAPQREQEEARPEEAAPAGDATVSPAAEVPPGEAEGKPEPLLPADQSSDFRTRWETIQAGFVDDPRRVVEEADSLVAEVMKRLAESFADERASLEGQWDRGDQVDTEDLRIALQRYRSFFYRLLSM